MSLRSKMARMNRMFQLGRKAENSGSSPRKRQVEKHVVEALIALADPGGSSR